MDKNQFAEEDLLMKELRVLYWESNHKIPTSKELELFSLQHSIEEGRMEMIL